MRTSLDNDALAAQADRLRQANLRFAERFPGESGRRQPVHTVYGGAQLFRADSTPKLGGVALRALEEYAPDADVFAEVLGIPAVLAETVYGRVLEKLRREPVEDFRIDFEDGYGNRPDAEEDGHAESVAREVAKGMQAGTLPPFLGIRIKTLNEELRARSVRTLDIFLSTLAAETGGALPDNFVLTLPKVTIPEQVEFFVAVLGALEERLGLERGRCASRSWWKRRSRSWGRRGARSSRTSWRAARGGSPGRTSAPTTTRPGWGSPPSTSGCATVPATSPGT